MAADESNAVVETEDQAAERLEQEVTIEDIGPARKRLTIEIPESRIAGAKEDMFDKLGSDAQVPGFRPGRVPRRLIEKRFGSAVRDDVKGQIIGESYQQAIDEKDLRVIGEPEVKDIESIELPDSGPLKVEIEIEVSPEVELPALEGITVEKHAVTVSDDEITEEIDKLRERFGKMTETEGKIKADDYVEAAVVVTGADGSEELITEDNAYLVVPGKSRDYKGHIVGIVIDDLGKQIKDKTIGDSLEVTMTGPESHENEKIKGLPITIKITVNKIHRVEPAEVDTIVTQFGMESEADLNEHIKTELQGRREREQEVALHEQITKHLMTQVKLELPKGLTGRQTDRVLNRKAMELAYTGATKEEIDDQVAQMRDSSEEEAAEQLKQFFILDAAAQQLEIEVQEQELHGRIAMLAHQQGRRPEKLRQEMHRSGDLEHLFMQMREQKTLDAILEKADVKEVAAPADDKKAKEPKASKKKTTKKKASKKKAAKKKDD